MDINPKKIFDDQTIDDFRSISPMVHSPSSINCDDSIIPTTESRTQQAICPKTEWVWNSSLPIDMSIDQFNNFAYCSSECPVISTPYECYEPINCHYEYR